jgi:hypothetical protein
MDVVLKKEVADEIAFTIAQMMCTYSEHESKYYCTYCYSSIDQYIKELKNSHYTNNFISSSRIKHKENCKGLKLLKELNNG